MENKIYTINNNSNPTLLEINKLISISYNISSAYLKSKSNLLLNQQNKNLNIQELSEKISASLFYLDEKGNIGLTEDHEKVYNEMGNEADFKYYLIDTIRKKVNEAIRNNF